jgi:hypothetical protein
MKKNILLRITHILVVCISFIPATLKAQATYGISGKVVDEMQLVMPGATVFLTGTKSSMATDLNGDFKLARLSPGTYQLIVNMLGYKPFQKEITIHDKDVTLRVQIFPDMLQLKEVKIKPDKNWFKNLQIFKQQFLGETENAAQCKFSNAEILSLDFDKKTKILKASANELLIINNRALGYKIKYLLLHFEYDKDKNTTNYKGYPSFEELKGTPEEEAKWKENRKKTYPGSIHHFIHSVYNQNLKAEGFTVYKIRNRAPFGASIAGKPIRLDYAEVAFDSLLTAADKNIKSLSYADALYVIYTKASEQSYFRIQNYTLVNRYTYRRQVPEGQVSIINQFGPVMIDDNGFFSPGQNLFFEGYMGWLKIADVLPLEYTNEE